MSSSSVRARAASCDSLDGNIPGSGVDRVHHGVCRLQPNALGTRPGISQGESEYTAGVFGFTRRMSRGIDLTATYTLGSAKSHLGNGTDELNANNLQDATLLYDDPTVEYEVLLSGVVHT